MHEPEKCEAMYCNLPGIYTDPSLDGAMYCLYHRRRTMDAIKESQIKDLEAERDHWIALAQKRGREIDELVIGLREITTRLDLMKKEFKCVSDLLKSAPKLPRPGWGN